ncbi:MerR family transcriptional regulator [Duganella fentianensis]|uniref:MerR family transcriptional regulator n=1 Tax=Duganella fentianensis TaxID=2692177 RepID=UPI0032B1E405
MTSNSPRKKSSALLRSSAVAQLAGMPVATLRIWEQRYQAIQPEAAPSGHRLYSAEDVRRVVMLRQLTLHGHAIGSIARLSDRQLQALQQQHDGPPAGVRTQVVGGALQMRLGAPPISAKLARPLVLLAPAETLAEALLNAAGGNLQLMLWHLPALQNSIPIDLRAARQNWPDCQLAVVYRYASASALASYAAAGIAVLDESTDDARLARWLDQLIAATPPLDDGDSTISAAARKAIASAAGSAVALPIAPRQFDNAVLLAITAMAPALECECPQHIAGLLRQLADFEIYSAGCAHDSTEDAELHTELQHIAAAARTMFEQALVRVASLKGIALDNPTPPSSKESL